MTEKDILWPVKKFEVQNFWSDSTIWNDFQFRHDDIIINTYSKSGTTWTQQIVSQLIFNRQENINISRISPWLDFRLNAESFGSKEKLLQTLENQTHRRCIKTHLSLDALVFSPKAKYIYVGRDGRDIACSLYNHLVNLICDGHAKPQSIQEIFQNQILSTSETSFFAHIRSWWNIRHLPNVLIVHFNQLKKDLPSEIKRIAKFLQIETEDLHCDTITEHCSFNYMKMNAENFIENKYFIDGAKTFFYQGTNERWKNVLSDEECQSYEKRAIEELGKEGARWLATGELEDAKQADQ
ncbi:unnamed protein product [Rotaria sordida]|uniref:Sulfotransferase domain-containing protein n=1 Tax=Rotaria sordida TaxID=392033 RepID=A0A815FUF8_9BILA|nr:unnamed protein product [Rotaria sordida]CAF4013179.1 unnamed protein product [Rotaria sordida]